MSDLAPDSAQSDVVRSYAKVAADIKAQAQSCGRDPAGVTLVAVSKFHGPETILPVLKAGHRVFGENRVQEAQQKWPALKALYPDVELHCIGPLQTNKVRDAVALFDVIETIDRPKLARVVAEEMARIGRYPACLIQVNTGREPQKAGVDPDHLDRFLDVCVGEYALPVKGLMCIPRDGVDPIGDFRFLAEQAARHHLGIVSMGMSGDYAAAIACGATHVRVGTAIFGPRPSPEKP